MLTLCCRHSRMLLLLQQLQLLLPLHYKSSTRQPSLLLQPPLPKQHATLLKHNVRCSLM